jgi:putative tricarboxylic transport membrane protein
MLEILGHVLNGIGTALHIPHLLAMIAGVSMGTVFGALPGLNATTGMALLLPIVYSFSDINIALLMLAGIYAGALYGGSISAILLGIPGTAAALPTTFDGLPMAKQGKAKMALLYGLYGSSFGGIIGALVLMFLTPTIASIAIKFGAPEMFALALWGMAMVSSVVGTDVLKGAFMAIMGLLISTVGASPANGARRFTFDNYNLIGGLSLVAMLLAALALPHVFGMINGFKSGVRFYESSSKEKKYFLRPKEIFVYIWTLIRSSILGVVVGIAPAAGPTIAAFMSYNSAKQASKNPETFGKGNPEGILAAETANNAAVGGSLVLTLALGIPGSAAAAIFMSSLIMKGMQPGPMLFKNNPGMVYTFFAGYLIINLLVFILGHVFVPLGAHIIRMPEKLLAPIILIVCVVGTYSETQTMFPVYTMLIACVVLYILDTMKFPVAPFLLGMILGPIMEANFWTTYSITYGKVWVIFKRPMFIVILLMAAFTFLWPMIKKRMKKS